MPMLLRPTDQSQTHRRGKKTKRWPSLPGAAATDVPDGVELGGGERAPPRVSGETGAAATEILDGVGLGGWNALPKVVFTAGV